MFFFYSFNRVAVSPSVYLTSAVLISVQNRGSIEKYRDKPLFEFGFAPRYESVTRVLPRLVGSLSVPDSSVPSLSGPLYSDETGRLAVVGNDRKHTPSGVGRITPQKRRHVQPNLTSELSGGNVSTVCVSPQQVHYLRKHTGGAWVICTFSPYSLPSRNTQKNRCYPGNLTRRLSDCRPTIIRPQD